MLTQLRAGALEIFTVGNNALGDVVPVAGITAVPFIFDGYKQVWSALDGPLGAYMRNAIRRANLYVFEKAWDAGFHQVVNQVRPIARPDDLKGLKLHTGANPVVVAAFRALGASPTPTAANEIYLALQTRLIDGAEVGLQSVESYKFYEYLKYISITNHNWTGEVAIANMDAMQRLPKSLRDSVDKRINDAATAERGDMARQDDALTPTLKAHGILFNQADTTALKSVIRSAGLYSQWRDQFGIDAWAALEKTSGKLA